MGGDDRFAVRSIRVVYGEVDRSLPGFWIVSGKYLSAYHLANCFVMSGRFFPSQDDSPGGGLYWARQYLVDAMHICLQSYSLVRPANVF